MLSGGTLSENSDLIQVLLARGLCSLTKRNGIKADTTTVAATTFFLVRPDTGFRYAIVTHLGFNIPPPPRMGRPISRADRQTIGTSYATVVAWTVSENRNGNLNEVALDSDNFSNMQWRLTIAGTQQWTDVRFARPLSMGFGECNIPENLAVTLAAVGDAGNTLCYGSISGVEWSFELWQFSISKAPYFEASLFGLDIATIRDGIPMWAYIDQGSPMQLGIRNEGGFGSENFDTTLTVLNIRDKQALEEIQRIVSMWNVAAQPAALAMRV